MEEGAGGDAETRPEMEEEEMILYFHISRSTLDITTLILKY